MSWGVTDLTVRFGARIALDGVSLDAAEGHVTAVVGGDGAGKSTLLRALVGAVTPTSGRVRKPDVRAIGYLAPSSGIYPDLTVQENLAFAAAAYGVPLAEAESRTDGYLERTGLAAARDRLAGNLSGGMRQKLGVIRALIHLPRLVVLDEPTTGVDPVSRADLWWLLARAAAGGAAVVLATTYLDEAERSAAVLVLDAGRTLAEGTPEAIAGGTPGRITEVAERPRGDAAALSWRRGSRWRVWTPQAGPGGAGTAPDFQDAVMVAALRRQAAAAAPVGERR
jgi:ABC-2 type transport system ATP-binding protein